MVDKRCLDFVLKWEGGYVNDPGDPGGETKYGISKRAYPTVDIRNLTKDEASSLYNRDYWIPCGCDTLEYPLNLVVFDSAVNCGVSRAKKWLKITKDPVKYLQLRTTHYQTRSPELKKRFLKGWLNRLADIRKETGII